MQFSNFSTNLAEKILRPSTSHCIETRTTVRICITAHKHPSTPELPYPIPNYAVRIARATSSRNIRDQRVGNLGRRIRLLVWTCISGARPNRTDIRNPCKIPTQDIQTSVKIRKVADSFFFEIESSESFWTRQLNFLTYQGIPTSCCNRNTINLEHYIATSYSKAHVK